MTHKPTPHPKTAMPAVWLHLAAEQSEDRRIQRWSVGIAFALHLLLALAASILIPPPSAGNELVVAQQPTRRVPEIRLEPPVVERTAEMPPSPSARRPVVEPVFVDPEPVEYRPRIEIGTSVDAQDLAVLAIPGPPPVQPTGPLRVGGQVEPPVRVSGPDPRYSEVARRIGLEGLVIVEAIINEQGTVKQIRVIKGLGFGLDEAAVGAIKQWRFEPATLHGEPVAVYYSLTVNFHIS